MCVSFADEFGVSAKPHTVGQAANSSKAFKCEKATRPRCNIEINKVLRLFRWKEHCPNESG